MNRRHFCSTAAAALIAAGGRMRAYAQSTQGSPDTNPLHLDVGAFEHDRILREANSYLNQEPTPITGLQCSRSPGSIHDYYSEAGPESSGSAPFTAHRDAVFTLGLAVPALTAAYVLTGDAKYSNSAVRHLRAWFIDPETRMAPNLNFGQVSLADVHPQRGFRIQDNAHFGTPPAPLSSGRYQGILDTLPLVEVALAVPFLASTTAFSGSELSALQRWFDDYLHWLSDPQTSGPRLGALARDAHDHNGVSWLLQMSAYRLINVPPSDAARSEDSTLAELRHRFRYVTLRAQINADGMFKNELGSPTPYRDSLFTLDMLAGVCQLLSTRFESVWEYQLEDGPGMRAAIAYHYPFIANRDIWPFRADADHFNDLPSRRASLLFAGRAYHRPEYVQLWEKLTPDPPAPIILRSIPIHQPLLWVRQPRPAV